MTAAERAPETCFFLSYARPPSGAGEHWVRMFFKELQAQVAHEARRAGRLQPGGELGQGFADFLPRGPERDAAVARALGSARVLVPLYSPEYLERSTTRRERATFLQRVMNGSTSPPWWRVQAVLWTPVSATGHVSDLSRALELGEDFPEYTRHGLETMRRLSEHREHYDAVVRRLAGRIVAAAHQPLPVAAEPVAEADVPGQAPADAATPFVIAVVAPSEGELPAQRLPACYGLHSVLWRPYRTSQLLGIADRTAQVARQFRMPDRIVDFADRDHLLVMYPGVILIDPWILAREDGRRRLQAAVEIAVSRQWVTLMVVVDRNDPQYAGRGSDLAREAMSMASAAQGSKLTREALEFEQNISKVVARNRRRYLSERPPPDGPPPTPRPRLRDPDDTGDPADPGPDPTVGEDR